MAHFQIYLPGVRGDGSKAAEAAGIPHLADCSWQDILQHGPDGGSGALGFWTIDTACFHLDQSDWIAAVPNGDLPAGRYWIGFNKAKPPTPGDLAFKIQFMGAEVELGDGRKWRIPAGGMLPKRFLLDSTDGRPKFVVREEFEEFFEASKRWYRLFLLAEADSGTVTIDSEWWGYLCRALAMNYRLTPEVVSHLELLDTKNVIVAALATVDGHTTSAAEKKTA